jgi:hypothetical protein
VSRDAAAGALVLQPFALLLVVLAFVAPPGGAQRIAADPVVWLPPGWMGALGAPLVAAAVGVGWWIVAGQPRLTRRDRRRVAGALAIVVVGLPLARLLLGPTLPGFIPPEEGARPGMFLGLSAGVLEEALVRLLALPMLLRTFRTQAAAVVASGIAFAMLHELGPGARAVDATHFFVRAVVPGAGMSALAVTAGYPFVVALHCGAHVLLPLLFA